MMMRDDNARYARSARQRCYDIMLAHVSVAYAARASARLLMSIAARD